MRLFRHLGEDAFGDVVVAAPVGRAFGIHELIHEIAALRPRKVHGGVVHLGRAVDEMALAAIELDQLDLAARRRFRHHRDERQPQHPREIGLRDGGAARRRLDHRLTFGKLAVAKRVKEERPRQPVLEAAGRMGAFILEIEIDAGKPGQVEPEKMRVGGPLEIRLDPVDRLVNPCPHDPPAPRPFRPRPSPEPGTGS